MEYINTSEDKLHEECGVFGIFVSPDASTLTALGLHALQHRGQEGAGIVSFDGEKFHGVRRPGLVGDHFNKQEVINRLQGSNAIGHVRYSTTGDSILKNIESFINDIMTYIKNFIGDTQQFYNLLILGLIVYVVIQLLHIFKININYTI